MTTTGRLSGTSAINRLRELYEGESAAAHRFRYALFAFDLLTILFVIVTSFTSHGPMFKTLSALLGLVVLADFLARLAISRRRLREFLHASTWADLVAIVSFFGVALGEGAGFLRILRTLRLLRNYRFLQRLRGDSRFFRRNEEAVLAAINLAVFIFVMTGVVYATQAERNPDIRNYMDALYFTVTSLTTTGFGDITLPGTVGRIITVVIMIAGVTLFLRLAQVLFRPSKVRFRCPQCGLSRHDADAVHCKACGILLNIPDEGAD
ncbi:potassium channel family protein [Aureimonas psammosilenae]|uniref:potassium channel family protein n=1 Tax=Aureimonas psammosilenae TaxID=2495496 RepID=UPI00186A822E|nr:potassium channel family protein [Aureimonas psammosilenae]